MKETTAYIYGLFKFDQMVFDANECPTKVLLSSLHNSRCVCFRHMMFPYLHQIYMMLLGGFLAMEVLAQIDTTQSV